LTIRDRQVVAEARVLGSRPSRVMTGDLRGSVLLNPVGQTSPAHVLGHFESHVAAVMRAHVHEGDVVYDIGANVGWHTLRLARLVGSTGRVYSFEPTPRDQRLLELNLAVNAVDVVRVERVAVSDVVGTVQFATFASPGVNRIAAGDVPRDAEVIDVDSTTLDAFVFDQQHEPPTFVKIDVEGGELEALLGGARLFESRRPIIVAEVRRDDRFPLILDFLERNGYEHSQLAGDEYLADMLFTPRLGVSRQAASIV
jgi:FkbM family methyltransferase